MNLSIAPQTMTFLYMLLCNKPQQQAELENIEPTRLRAWLLSLLMNGQVRVA